MIIRNHCGLSILLALGLLGGCGDNGGTDDEAAATEESATDDAATDEEVGTDAGTETADTADAETDAETTVAETTDAETTDAETDAETTDAETTDAETTDAETGNPDPCADLETADDCMAMAGCQVVNGSHLKANGPDSPCLEASEYLGCISEQGCGDMETWFCQGNQMYLVPDTCGPNGADPCDAPADPVSDCP